MPTVTVPTVTRTMRVATKVGEDYVTLEEVVTLPLDASDDDIAHAVALGLRIYQAQHDALDAQVATIRADADAAPVPAITMREPDAPASDKQRQYMATLQAQLGWSDDQLTHAAGEHQIDLATLTKGKASTLIEHLKQMIATPETVHTGPYRPGNEEQRQRRQVMTRAATPAPTPQRPPASSNEAEQRFFARYANQIGGTDWNAVRRFLRQAQVPKPSTIDGWYKAARQVQTAPAQHTAA